MTTPRKTIKVATLRNKVNDMIAYSAANHPEHTADRVALANLLQTVLLDTDNYKGFSFEDGELGSKDHSNIRFYG